MNLFLEGGGSVGQPVFSTSATQFHPLGTKAKSRDGRVFRYVKAGALLVVGNILQSRAQDVDQNTHTLAEAAAIGATQVTITVNTSGDVDANEYAEGWLCVDTTAGIGYMYRINSHPAAAAAASLVLTLDTDTPVQVALVVATSKLTLVYNPWKNVIQSPATTLTGTPVGACVYPIASGEFGWIQTSGPAGLLISGTPAVGLPVGVPHTVAGAVIIDDADATTSVVGHMMMTGVDAIICPVMLHLE